MELGSTLPKTEKITIGLNMSLDFYFRMAVVLAIVGALIYATVS